MIWSDKGKEFYNKYVLFKEKQYIIVLNRK